MKRIAVVGTTGSGKTTLGEKLSKHLGVPFVDLDTLFWLPGWQESSVDAFRQKVEQVTFPEAWVIAGNYSKARDIIWARADTLVWLDYPLLVSLWQLFGRTVRRIVSQEDLWGTGNRETWRKQFLSRESLFLWAVKTHRRRKREYPVLLSQPEYAHLHLIRLASPRDTKEWLRSL